MYCASWWNASWWGVPWWLLYWPEGFGQGQGLVNSIGVQVMLSCFGSILIPCLVESTARKDGVADPMIPDKTNVVDMNSFLMKCFLVGPMVIIALIRKVKLTLEMCKWWYMMIQVNPISMFDGVHCSQRWCGRSHCYYDEVLKILAYIKVPPIPELQRNKNSNLNGM